MLRRRRTKWAQCSHLQSHAPGAGGIVNIFASICDGGRTLKIRCPWRQKANHASMRACRRKWSSKVLKQCPRKWHWSCQQPRGMMRTSSAATSVCSVLEGGRTNLASTSASFTTSREGEALYCQRSHAGAIEARPGYMVEQEQATGCKVLECMQRTETLYNAT